ncbi:ATP phosphoribosyltransferase [Chryseobacterium sp. SORGH_AS909]|uniref:ATP phosphoribosyltransferase n=2 Tax=Chryseobacterium group TaxID=2782232 RepID=A0ABU0TGJ1_9FLAO|nr:ATP phosphoribosyltransferase [Chryseobacterium camelliae]MDQ1100116.1 ATP phosphoribosyltransferase [Chryseobacterium sp. SORGH_AS_1048]MDR6087459.1 ATP phosphoribosyltransferase [Chryseobacterium sp. SORGH_AS_0909]MDR6131833.1 ATP phosphoribosyltransferase [Chryseobacterium sp. SORGH_AS_1175]MDT3406020.1 ATP phosphoribosyltransferase [Pseudacidovorax intermedius]
MFLTIPGIFFYNSTSFYLLRPKSIKMSILKIAIQKSGRLYEDSLQLLRDCGIDTNNGKDQLKVSVNNFPMEIMYLRNSDIPQYLEDGVVDVAIVGENLLAEKQKNSGVVQKLGFSRCRVSLAVPKDVDTDELSYFQGKKIATSYPNTLKKFLDERGITADIHVISGSVEIAPNIGLADGICDIVSSGSTLFKNGLRETITLLQSEAVLAKNTRLGAEKELILQKFLFRIKAVLKAKNSKYILMNVPDGKIAEISSVLPVLKSPTVIPLAEKGWSSIHSVIDEDRFWEVIDELKAKGAQDILIIPIDKMVI